MNINHYTLTEIGSMLEQAKKEGTAKKRWVGNEISGWYVWDFLLHNIAYTFSSPSGADDRGSWTLECHERTEEDAALWYK